MAQALQQAQARQVGFGEVGAVDFESGVCEQSRHAGHGLVVDMAGIALQNDGVAPEDFQEVAAAGGPHQESAGRLEDAEGFGGNGFRIGRIQMLEEVGGDDHVEGAGRQAGVAGVAYAKFDVAGRGSGKMGVAMVHRPLGEVQSHHFPGLAGDPIGHRPPTASHVQHAVLEADRIDRQHLAETVSLERAGEVVQVRGVLDVLGLVVPGLVDAFGRRRLPGQAVLRRAAWRHHPPPFVLIATFASTLLPPRAAASLDLKSPPAGMTGDVYGSVSAAVPCQE